MVFHSSRMWNRRFELFPVGRANNFNNLYLFSLTYTLCNHGFLTVRN